MVASRAKETKQQILPFFKLHVHFEGYRQSLEATNKAHTNCYIPVSRYSTDDLCVMLRGQRCGQYLGNILRPMQEAVLTLHIGLRNSQCVVIAI